MSPPPSFSLFGVSKASQSHHTHLRRVFVNEAPTSEYFSRRRPLQRFATNKVSTSKYNLFTFLPKNLFEQFRKVANLFFLTVAILQFFPDYQNIDPIVAALPLMVIVAMTAIKDGIEDMRRHQSDKKMNAQPVLILASEGWTNQNSAFCTTARSNPPVPVSKSTQIPASAKSESLRISMDPRWSTTTWGDVQVGDVVLLHNDDAIPADMIILASSEPGCLCYVETKNLDGETNLKIRKGMEETSFLKREEVAELFAVEEDGRKVLRFSIESEQPNPSLYNFTGAAVFAEDAAFWLKENRERLASTSPSGAKPAEETTKASTKKVRIPLNINEILLRGCVIRNTEWVIGLVIFTGLETKICLNSDATPSKQSKIDKDMNPQVILNLIILIILSLANAIACPLMEFSYMNSSNNNPIVWLYSSYPGATTSRSNWGYTVFVSFWSSIIAYQNIVPISLYITVELVKSIQAYFIYSDLDMYYEPIDQPCVPRSWNLADDLGQIDYVFSDKTGTLTRNIMQFKKCSINGVIYGKGVHDELPSSPRFIGDFDDKISFAELLPSAAITPATAKIRKSLGTISLTEIALRNGNLRRRISTINAGTNLKQTQECEPPAFHPAVHKGWSLGPWIYRKGSTSPTATGPDPTRASKSSLKKVAPASFSSSVSASGAKEKPWGGGGGGGQSTMDELRFVDPLLSKELKSTKAQQYKPLREFFTSLAVCHSVLVNTETKDGISDIRYMAQSPDEAALVQAARDVGITFLDRMDNAVIVDVLGQQERSTLLNVIEFNSTRKRMTVIVRRPGGEIVLYCKGADSVIYERLAPGQDVMKDLTAGHLEQFADEGLRTLCIAYSILTEDQYVSWAEKFQEASTAIMDRDKKMDEVAELIETNLLLMGASAIEDKLQEGVPECIETLLSAGIKLWVLTGDKMETAINIGFSCNLLTKEMVLVLIRGGQDNSDGASLTRKQMMEALSRFFGPQKDLIARPSKANLLQDCDETGGEWNPHRRKSTYDQYALVIDGAALRYALEEENKALFLDLATRCSAVICCRVSPLQKAKVVELVKNSRKTMCLAIGDGANDVSMIQAAHIGVGIAGEEGLQAVMASDYAIAQFKYLSKLLLVHGHWSYYRTAEMILNFFFKNMVFVFVLFWYQIYCVFSSEMIYDISYMILYNIVFTGFPVGMIGIFDKDAMEESFLTSPALYKPGEKVKAFSLTRFAIYTLDAIWHSLICFYVVLSSFNEQGLDNTGRPTDKGDFAITLVICAIMNSNIFVALNLNSWNLISMIVQLAVGAIVLIYTAIYSSMGTSLLPGVGGRLLGRWTFWLTFGIQIFICVAPRCIVMYLFRSMWPTDIQIVQELQQRKRKGIVASEDDLTLPLRDKEAMSDDWSKQPSQPDSRKTTSVGVLPPILKDKGEDKPAAVEQQTLEPTIKFEEPTPTQPLQSATESPSKRQPPPRLQLQSRTVQSEPDIPGIAITSEDDDDEGSEAGDGFGPLYSMTGQIRAPVITPVSSPWQARSPQSPSAAMSQSSDGGLLTVMKTGELLRHRGFSFSQSEGARQVLMARLQEYKDQIVQSPLSPFRVSESHGSRLNVDKPPPFLRTNTSPPNT